ncbi:MAG: GNAT family N-acetyltransferase [Flavobacteriaceae bacterium]
MRFLKIKNNFTFDFFIKRSVYTYYDNIHNITNNQDFFNKAPFDKKSIKKVVVVNNIPPYLDARLHKEKITFKLFKIYHLDGFLADINEYSNLDEYMKDQFGSKSRSEMRRYLRRLETCFSIQYKMYYGEITKKEFSFLFEELRKMIQRRFSQRGDTHQGLKHWDYLKSTVFEMILEKKASFFVIFDKDQPIDICLNYHHQNILRNYIRSYDIDYSKFRLGYIDILKQLEWCFENNHSILDLSYGDLAYKRTWCNKVYTFEQHIIYNEQYLSQKIWAFTITVLLQLKWLLEKRGVLTLYYKLRSLFKRKAAKKMIYEEAIFEVEDISHTPLNTISLSKINSADDIYTFIRKPIYNFQYLNFEISDDITIYKINDHPSSFIISGKRKKQKITQKTHN